MKKKIYSVCCFCLSIFIGSGLLTPAWAFDPKPLDSRIESAIYSVDTFDFLTEESEFFDEDSLVVFDVDKVLLIKADPWEREHQAKRRKAKTIASLYVKGSALSKKLDRSTRDRLWSLYARTSQLTLIDEKVPTLIKKLQSKSVKVMALTDFLLGKVGTISSLKEWRIRELFSQGIDFSNSFPDQGQIMFKQFFSRGKTPLFKKGILFTDTAFSKGQALKTFFETIGWWPKRVIMIDDKIENLKSVQENLKVLNIPYKGYEYKAHLKIPAFFDKKIAEFQMRYLIKHEKWIDASKAKALLALGA